MDLKHFVFNLISFSQRKRRNNHYETFLNAIRTTIISDATSIAATSILYSFPAVCSRLELVWAVFWKSRVGLNTCDPVFSSHCTLILIPLREKSEFFSETFFLDKLFIWASSIGIFS